MLGFVLKFLTKPIWKGYELKSKLPGGPHEFVASRAERWWDPDHVVTVTVEHWKKTGLLKNNNDFKTCCSIHTITCIFYTHFATRLYIILKTCAKTFGFQELQGSCCTTFGPRFPKVQFPTVPRMNRSVHFLAMCTQWTLKNPPDNNSQYRDSCYFKHISKTHVEILCPVWSLT